MSVTWAAIWAQNLVISTSSSGTLVVPMSCVTGHSSMGRDIQRLPFCHSLFSSMSLTVAFMRVPKSEMLSADFTWYHMLTSVVSRHSVTRLPMKGRRADVSFLNVASVHMESIMWKTFSNFHMEFILITSLRRTAMMAACSSIRGIVIFFRGVTRVFAVHKVHWNDVSSHSQRMYAAAHIACSEPSLQMIKIGEPTALGGLMQRLKVTDSVSFTRLMTSTQIALASSPISSSQPSTLLYTSRWTLRSGIFSWTVMGHVSPIGS